MTFCIRTPALSRRTMLRGSGAALALPLLEAMTPGLDSPSPGKLRSVFLFSPNGFKMDDWRPAEAGPAFAMPHLLEPLAGLRQHFSVYSNLAIDAGRSHGDGTGDHARAAATYLTCVHPKKTGGADIRAGVSVDQVIARHTGKQTLFPSIELGMERGRSAGSCDSGYACAYSNNISWRDERNPMPKETHPKAAFARMFANPDRKGRSERAQLRSVLDAVQADVKDLRGRLGRADRAKLEGYQDAVRSIEKRLQRLEQGLTKAPVGPEFWQREGGHYLTRLQTMYDLIVLALQTDQTRVLTFMLGNAGSGRSYRFLGIPEGHHGLSHHRGKKNYLAKIKKINRFHTEQFARFLQRLADTEDGDQSLLYRSQILFGSGLGDGNRHDHMRLPILLCGHGNGAHRPGSHEVLPRHTPAAGLYLRMIQAHGIERSAFADSKGVV